MKASTVSRLFYSGLLFTIAVSPARAVTELEVTGPIVVTPVNDLTYNTAGIAIGNNLYIYAQTIDYEQCPNNGDAIVAYRTGSTPSGPYTVVANRGLSPTLYQNARTDPFRWNSASGKRYLFSSTNDRNMCSQFLWSSLAGQQIVVTTVANQP